MDIPNPNHSWAQVELFRWQYGCLPEPNDFRPLDEPTALRNMGKAIIEGCKTGDRENMPSPTNVVSVLEYVASLIEEDRQYPSPKSKHSSKPKPWK